MPKVKKKRVGVKLDMTPMVDVAFLLLTFFMLTTTFKPQEDVEILVPGSHSAIKLPTTSVMTVFVDKGGEVYIGLETPAARAATFGEAFKYKAQVPVPKDQIRPLLIKARTNNPNLRTVLKSDKDAPYAAVEDVIDAFKEAQINRFSLVTSLEATM